MTYFDIKRNIQIIFYENIFLHISLIKHNYAQIYIYNYCVY